MNREEQFDFANFFSAKLKERGLSLRKLSELSGISVQDLQNLSEGDFEHLPPAPYLRGYTVRLATILEFDPEIWWRHFIAIGVVRTSGIDDQLPKNRFALSKTTRYGWIVVVGIVLLLYGGLRFSKILGRPTITVTTPTANPVRVDRSPITIQGIVENGDQVRINGEQIPVENGQWSKEITLEEGVNTVAIHASKLLGKQADVQWQIIYEPPIPATTTPSEAPIGTPSSSTSSSHQ